MTFPSSGLLSTTQSLINTTVAQAATAVLDPSYAATGTAQINQGSNAYPFAYGASAMVLATQGALPVTNTYMISGATAPASNANLLFGVAQIGAMQGNSQNPAASIDAQIPAVFSLIYQQLLNMASLIYRI